MSESKQEKGEMSFWDHLDVLRVMLIKGIVAVVVCAVVAFIFKETLFEVVLAPREAGFVTYVLLNELAASWAETAISAHHVQLISTGLAEQFVLHVKTAMSVGVIAASPYLLYLLFRFVSPGLYAEERRQAVRLVGSGYLMFMIGVLVSYYVVFPLTFRFLGTYQVDPGVENLITLNSYIETLMVMSLSLGIVFEMPVMAWLFAKMGLLNAVFMRNYRRHAIVIILIVAAVITPTSDIFTLLLVAMPMVLLYELSIAVVALNERRKGS